MTKVRRKQYSDKARLDLLSRAAFTNDGCEGVLEYDTDRFIVTGPMEHGMAVIGEGRSLREAIDDAIQLHRQRAIR